MITNKIYNTIKIMYPVPFPLFVQVVVQVLVTLLFELQQAILLHLLTV